MKSFWAMWDASFLKIVKGIGITILVCLGFAACCFLLILPWVLMGDINADNYWPGAWNRWPCLFIYPGYILFIAALWGLKEWSEYQPQFRKNYFYYFGNAARELFKLVGIILGAIIAFGCGVVALFAPLVLAGGTEENPGFGVHPEWFLLYVAYLFIGITIHALYKYLKQRR
jgi:hypothetical protein